ncbi:MAG: DNA repair protein RadA, partial [Melioribacteraceae bacterium]|nr:DNA repair protein RadA [Melioribacteraceae bacterium]
GEVGLGGEVRSVGNIEKRIQEAEKLGFENIYLPQNNMKNLVRKNHLSLIPVRNISDAIEELY